MCGIAGRVNFRSGAPVDAAVIGRMMALLAHRGPDGEGLHVTGPVGLGHRRLAVLDLSPAGAQPMASEDGQAWIVHNGEIYNFREVRAELEGRGHRFRSGSDTEVLLAAYREFGVDCLERLRGMFAFAVWDAARRRLVLARDRLGTKPLFYWIDDDGLAFASAVGAFLADPTFPARVDLEAVWHYLTYQYVPSPLAAFEGVRKLPAGHSLVIEDGTVSIARYWRLRYATKRRPTEREAGEELLVRLRDAVRLRLVSDVPIGVFLSGGVDSGTVVALMAELGVSPLRTFSIGFEEPEFDELRFARLVAERYGTDHHEFVVRPDAVGILPKLVRHYGEPFADSSAIPTYCLAELTRRHVTVALNGDAGDENFAGYDRYLANVLAGRLDRAPRFVRDALGRLGRALPVGAGSRGVLARARRLVEVLGQLPARRYVRWMSHFTADQKAELCTAEFRQRAGGRESEDLLLDLFRDSDAPDLVDAMLDVDVQMYLPDDLLVKVDVATMAHGLEARSPLLDHRFVQWCASLPSDLKLRGRVWKYLVKRAVRPLLPAAVVQRPKMGFGVPLDRWLRHELREMVSDLLLSPRACGRGYFHRPVVERLVREHVEGVRRWPYQLWNLLVLELWHRVFIDDRRGALEATPAPPAGPSG